MKIRDLMTKKVVKIAPEESVAVAARTLAANNVGILPVCDHRGKVQGLVTDRDLVTRCVAANCSPEKTSVADVMTQLHSTAKCRKNHVVRTQPRGIGKLQDLYPKVPCPPTLTVLTKKL